MYRSGSGVIKTDGSLAINTDLSFSNSSRVNNIGNASSNLSIQSALTSVAGVAVSISSSGGITNGNGTSDILRLTSTFNPSTSGTGIMNALEVQPTINQTGGANGITRGIYVNPTLTAAADYRAIETTVGNVIINNGNVGIGTTSPSQLLTVGNNNQFTVDSSGNVTLPTGILQVGPALTGTSISPTGLSVHNLSMNGTAVSSLGGVSYVPNYSFGLNNFVTHTTSIAAASFGAANANIAILPERGGACGDSKVGEVGSEKISGVSKMPYQAGSSRQAWCNTWQMQKSPRHDGPFRWHLKGCADALLRKSARIGVVV